MPTVIVGQANNADIEIHFKDHGAARRWGGPHRDHRIDRAWRALATELA